MNQRQASRIFSLSDAFWLIGIFVAMLTSGIWEVLSPRPEIGQVAVLWLPSAVLMVAFLRNWTRPVFVFLALTVFYGAGMVRAFDDNSFVSAFSLLTLDVIEVVIIVTGLRFLGGLNFRLASALNVSFFLLVTLFATGICGVLAGLLSAYPIGPSVIASNAPLQVGVAWFTSNLATYFLAATPLTGLTDVDRRLFYAQFQERKLWFILIGFSIAMLTWIGHVLPQYLAIHTGLKLGSGGLVLISFPLATYFAFKHGPVLASLCGAVIGIPTIYATMAGFGPFGSGDASANIFEMQATLIVCTFTLVLIGAMADQLRERSKVLEKTLDQQKFP